MRVLRSVRLAGLAWAAMLPVWLAGCPSPTDAIAVSNVSYDFGKSQQSWNFEVWNNGALNSVTFTVKPDVPWMYCTPSTATSTGPADKRVITVAVTRQGLAAGTYQGRLTITAPGVAPVQVTVSLYSDGAQGVTGSDLNVAGLTYAYSAPYLLDFTFSLHDRFKQPVIGEPAQFKVSCRENNAPIVADESPPRFAKASSKQANCFLVLDYSASMASIAANGDLNEDGISDAIQTMESGARTVFLPALSADARVGVYEFHRETEPEKVCELTADKDFVANRIKAIWSQFVHPYSGISRCWDAVYSAVEEFTPENQNDEIRDVVFLSDGFDTSSFHTKEEAVEIARERGVRIYAIGYGNNPNTGVLQSVASQTNGAFYPAANAVQLETAFRQIVNDFDARYTLRWATLKRSDVKFLPSFYLTIANRTASYESPYPYVVADYVSDELRGRLRTVPSKSNNRTTIFLRASYVCRYIWKLRFYVESPYAFTVQKVEAPDGGLCASWTQSIEHDGVLPGVWVVLESPAPGLTDTQLPFAAFGPILRFDFNTLIDEDVDPFQVLYVDNSFYTGGQAFSIDGWTNTPPGS